MTTLKNFVAVDWRDGLDRIHFFFKDDETYSRFDLGDNCVGEGYPCSVYGNWDDFSQHAKDVRCGFTTSGLDWDGAGGDLLVLFYYEGKTPMVCRYSQGNDCVVTKTPVSQSIWAPLKPYFDKIVGVMWLEESGRRFVFWILLNDGNYLSYNAYTQELHIKPLKGSYWAYLEKYKGRMITAVKNDAPLLDTYFYIFLTNNQYLRYDCDNRVVTGPFDVNEATWRGLIPS
ncbi:hypothetical protein ACYZT8_20130 [Pseudomonas sp. LB3P93]